MVTICLVDLQYKTPEGNYTAHHVAYIMSGLDLPSGLAWLAK
jgi:hypothetical protein